MSPVASDSRSPVVPGVVYSRLIMSSASHCTPADDVTFAELGVTKILCDALEKSFAFTAPLPVQRVVIPRMLASLRSGLPADLCLCAPTGSGKTLCYLLPALEAVRQWKEFAVDVVQLRAVILVPTNTLALQVAKIARKLVAAASLNVAVLALGDGRNTDGAGTRWSAGVSMSAAAVSRTVPSSILQSLASTDVPPATIPAVPPPSWYHRADVVVTTPHRFLHELLDEVDEGEAIPAARRRTLRSSRLDCASVRLLILDEADSVLSGVFATLARRVAARMEADVASDGAGSVLHKILCSATMTEHVSRVAEIRLRNVSFLSLDENGRRPPDAKTAAPHDDDDDDAATAARRAGGRIAGVASLTAKVALPKGLTERYVVVDDDSGRHATLLNVVRAALRYGPSFDGYFDRLAAAEKAQRRRPADSVADVPPSSLPPLPDAAKQSTVLVLCGTPQVARVICHLLATSSSGNLVDTEGSGKEQKLEEGGVTAGAGRITTIELTAATTPQQRAAAVAAGYTGKSCVVVATDAVMRGIDLPGVAVVVMYDAPVSLQQYVHRVGRTARGGGRGAAVCLLSKVGPSGTHEDGEVARYKAMDAHLLRPNGLPRQLFSLRHIDTGLRATADAALRGAVAAMVSAPSTKRPRQAAN